MLLQAAAGGVRARAIRYCLAAYVGLTALYVYAGASADVIQSVPGIFPSSGFLYNAGALFLIVLIVCGSIVYAIWDWGKWLVLAGVVVGSMQSAIFGYSVGNSEFVRLIGSWPEFLAGVAFALGFRMRPPTQTDKDSGSG